MSSDVLGPICFAGVFAAGLVLSSWRYDAVVDANERSRRELPPVLKGDAATRGLFDPVWLIRYRCRMKSNPIPPEEQSR